MTKTKAFVSIFVIFAAELILGIIDYPIINSAHEFVLILLFFTLRTEFLAVGAGILLKKFVGKSGWTILFCGIGTIAALAVTLLCFSNGGTMFLLEFFFLMITAPIAALYYLFTYIFLTKPDRKALFIGVTAFVTIVLTIISISFSFLIAQL